MTASVSAKGPATARCAVSATSVHVPNNQAMCAPSFVFGQGFATSQALASPVAASSSSAAASIMILFTWTDAENLRSAAVTRCRTVVAWMRQRYAFGSFPMVDDEGRVRKPTCQSGLPIPRTMAILASTADAP